MGLYEKNLTEDLRLRLSLDDMDFLRKISDERGQTVSTCIRSIIGEYRRSLQMMEVMKKVISLSEEGRLSDNGDTKTDFDNKL